MIAAQTVKPSFLAPDISAILDMAESSTWPEKLIEYAGRVCYASEHNMGKAPGFIGDRVREGHEDIIEHAWVSIWMEGVSPETRLAMMRVNRYVEIDDDGVDGIRVSGNLRVWHELIKAGLIEEGMAARVANVAPTVFADLVTGDQRDSAVFGYYFPKVEGITTQTDLLGLCYDPGFATDKHQHATFQLDGVSRALTHQLVRHRAGSFSQASQRYISLEKGGWSAVVPPSIAADDRAHATLDKFWREAERTYADMVRYKIRKEDARFILPNAATTKIIVSMSFAYWKHFLWLRALDKAAQWEIRYVAQDILRYLYAIAPNNFAKEMECLTNNESVLTGK